MGRGNEGDIGVRYFGLPHVAPLQWRGATRRVNGWRGDVIGWVVLPDDRRGGLNRLPTKSGAAAGGDWGLLCLGFSFTSMLRA